MSNVQSLVAPNCIIRKERKLYNEDESLTPLTTLAAELGVRPTAQDFDESEFIEITYLRLEKLYTDVDYQRLIDLPFINSAKKFDPKLFRPVIVFKRPNGKHTVGDGQHESILGILYTKKGGKTRVPCQVHVHPSYYTIEQCVAAEAKFFEVINKRRNNVNQLSQLRAGISYGDPTSLATEDKIRDMGVHLQKIGNPEGPEVHGLSKLINAHSVYGVSNVIKAIRLYQQIQNDTNFPKWNDSGQPLQGSLISGLAAVYFLKERELGEGDKDYALSCYLKEYLGTVTTKELCLNTAGVNQAILIARRIVTACNGLIQARVLKKRNGDTLMHHIAEDMMSNAGLKDPSK